MGGITLIELLVVLALTSILATLSIGPGIQEFEHTLARMDGTRMAAIARHARARAMHGIPGNMQWSEQTKSLVIGGGESYPLTGNEHGTNTGQIVFLGSSGDYSTGTIRLQNESSSTWNLVVDSGGAINLVHDL